MLFRFILISLSLSRDYFYNFSILLDLNTFEYKFRKKKKTKTRKKCYKCYHSLYPSTSRSINLFTDEQNNTSTILFTFLSIHTTQYFKRKAKTGVGARLIVWDTLLLVFFSFWKKLLSRCNGCAGKTIGKQNNTPA